MPKCLICKEKFVPQYSSLEKACRKEECRYQAGLILLDKKRKADEKKAKKDWNIEKREKLNSLKTPSEWEKDLQTEINQIVKYLDVAWPCISSGNSTGKRNAGHYISIGSNPTIRFHLMNIYNQSEHDNSYKSGNPLKYREGIIKTFGAAHLEYIESLQSIKPLHLSIPEIKEKIAIARQIVKELKAACKSYSLDERLSMRVELNQRLGIYTK